MAQAGPESSTPQASRRTLLSIFAAAPACIAPTIAAASPYVTAPPPAPPGYIWKLHDARAWAEFSDSARALGPPR